MFLISSWAEAADYRAPAGREWLQAGEEMKAVELQGGEGCLERVCVGELDYSRRGAAKMWFTEHLKAWRNFYKGKSVSAYWNLSEEEPQRKKKILWNTLVWILLEENLGAYIKKMLKLIPFCHVYGCYPEWLLSDVHLAQHWGIIAAK